MAFTQLLCCVELLFYVQSYGKSANFSNKTTLILDSILENGVFYAKLACRWHICHVSDILLWSPTLLALPH